MRRIVGDRSVATRVLAARAVVVILLVPLGFYAIPRAISLVEIPTAFDESLDHGRAYNPRIVAIVDHERNTLAALAALDRIDAALGRVRRTDAAVTGQLQTLVGQIRTQVQPVLNQTNVQVDGLLSSLDEPGGTADQPHRSGSARQAHRPRRPGEARSHPGTGAAHRRRRSPGGRVGAVGRRQRRRTDRVGVT
jgi:hypothetical protein